MSERPTRPTATKRGARLSVDAMGGDTGPSAVLDGLDLFFSNASDATVLLHGNAGQLQPLVDKHRFKDRIELRHAEGEVTMSDKPSHVMRHGKGTSMWSAIEAVRDGEAAVCVSCGNTGALMAVSMIRLRKADGVNRPAIACLWPSENKGGYNIMLDVGADIRADEEDFLVYAFMGASYARAGLGLSRPRIGLLNVGTEDHKGRAELRIAHELLSLAADKGGFEFVGFVEGSDIPSDRVDVIVTDGFTGNVALKTGEGTATIISNRLRYAFTYSLWSKLSAFFGRRPLKRFARSIDPRRANGGVFLGLNGTVVKSHGSADGLGIAAALDLAWELAQSGFSERLATEVAEAALLTQDIAVEARG